MRETTYLGTDLVAALPSLNVYNFTHVDWKKIWSFKKYSGLDKFVVMFSPPSRLVSFDRMHPLIR